MRRHREEMALSGAAGANEQWVILQQDQEDVVGHGAHRPPVLLELFVELAQAGSADCFVVQDL
jgi:hypothetical protein